MSDDDDAPDRKPPAQQARFRVKLPGFIGETEIGLGDLLTQTNYAFAIKPCGGCERRAAALNRFVSFRR